VAPPAELNHLGFIFFPVYIFFFLSFFHSLSYCAAAGPGPGSSISFFHTLALCFSPTTGSRATIQEKLAGEIGSLYITTVTGQSERVEADSPPPRLRRCLSVDLIARPVHAVLCPHLSDCISVTPFLFFLISLSRIFFTAPPQYMPLVSQPPHLFIKHTVYSCACFQPS